MHFLFRNISSALVNQGKKSDTLEKSYIDELCKSK